MTDVVLSAKEISWQTPDGITIVSGITLDVYRGEVLGIIGPNGAGKTTFLKLLYRALKPSTGQVLLDGQDAWSIPRDKFSRNMSVVLQETPADFALTVRDVVATGRLPYIPMFDKFGEDHREVVEHCLARFHLQSIADRPYTVLSGGEKQRVVFARAMAQEAKIMLLDEPTNHLDIHHQLDVMVNLRNWAETIVLTVHDINLAARYCDRILVINQGQAVACGTPDEVLSSQIFQSVFAVTAEITQDPRHGKPWFAFYPDTSTGDA